MLVCFRAREIELDDVDPIHIEWELKNAIELSKSLEEIGGDLHFATNDMITTLEKINLDYGISSYCHMKKQEILGHIKGISWSKIGAEIRVLTG